LRVSLSRGWYSNSEQPLAARLTANTPIVLVNLIAWHSTPGGQQVQRKDAAIAV
jgi:hypothetical protein